MSCLHTLNLIWSISTRNPCSEIPMEDFQSRRRIRGERANVIIIDYTNDFNIEETVRRKANVLPK